MINERSKTSMRVYSDFFVGREQEIEEFFEFMYSKKKNVLCLHSKELGGIGKTKLLEKLLSECKDRKSEILCPRYLIDFYHTEARTRMGVIQLIAQTMKNSEKDFHTFYSTYKKIAEGADIEDNVQLIKTAEKTFYDDFGKLIDINNKRVILFFDTYENIQKAELSVWLETEFIQKLGPRTKIVFSGRSRLEHLKPEEFKEMEIKPFSFKTTTKYFKEYFKDDKRFVDTFGHEYAIEKINQMAEGRPILLALFVDWINYPRNSLNPAKFIEDIYEESRDDDNPEEKRKILFKSKLIQRIADLENPSDEIVIHLALLYRRMTSEMLSYIIEKSEDDCKEILSELKPLSFIKYKHEEKTITILLHDEMRDLILELYFPSHGIGEDSEIWLRMTKKAKRYYDKWLHENKSASIYRQTDFQAERLHYFLSFDLLSGFKEFKKLFESNFKDNNIDFCELYLDEVKEYYERFDPSKQLEIDYAEMKVLNEKYRTRNVLDIYQKIRNSKDKYSSLEQNISLKADFLREKGVAHLWENNFEQAIKDFISAEKDYRKIKEDKKYYLCLIHNWIGYAYLRQGNFTKAEDFLLKSEREFLNTDPIYYEKAAATGEYIDISNVYGNLSATYRYMGRFYEGGIYSKMADIIANVKQTKREHARFLIAQAYLLIMSNRTFDAEKCLGKAKAFLRQSPNSILDARLLIVSGVLKSRYVIFYNYILETFLICKGYEDAVNKFKRIYGIYIPARKSNINYFDSAIDDFKKARTLLEETNIHKTDSPKSELADANYFQGVAYMISQRWDEAKECFSRCELLSRNVKNDYWRFQAMVGKLSIFYLQRKTEDFERHYKQCMEQLLNAKNQYNNILGKLSIIYGNYLFNRWLREEDVFDFKEAIRQYVLACDYMLGFTRFGKDRFYKTIYIIVKRISEVPLHKLPSINVLEELSDIWFYQESEREVSKQYYEFLDSIIDFAIKRKSFLDKPNERKKYSEFLKQEAQRYIQSGRQLLQRAPIIAKMKLQIEIDSGDILRVAEAYHWLAYCFSANTADFEVLYHEMNSLDMIESLDKNTMNMHANFRANVLKARIYIRLGATNYRHGQFTKAIESYLAGEFEENFKDFLKHQDELDSAFEYLSKAKRILDKCHKECAQDQKTRNAILFARAHQEFRMAEYLLLTKKKSINAKEIKIIENLYEGAIAHAEESENNFRKINAIESWIALYYYCGMWNKMEGTKIKALRSQFQEATEKEYNPIISGRLKMILGNVGYDKILDIEKAYHSDDHLLEDTLRSAFTYYIEAARHKHGYSYKNYYEIMGVILDRIANLSERSKQKLKKDILLELLGKTPRSDEAETAQALLESFLKISCDKRYISK